MSEAPGPLNFTMFLTLFGEKLTGECLIHYSLPVYLPPCVEGGGVAKHYFSAFLVVATQWGNCLVLRYAWTSVGANL